MKTIGKVSADLIRNLYDRNRVIFTIADVESILNTSREAISKLLFDLQKRKIIFRLKRGKYILIPQELGTAEEFIGNVYVAAKEIVNSPDYYIGFYSAMKYWGMVTQPVLKTYIATPKRQFPPENMKDIIAFVFINRKNIYGIKEEWVTKTQKVRISGIEKTIVDALTHPEYCGGITEAAKSIWIVKDKINFSRLTEYVRKNGKSSVAKRLGYILETVGVGGNIMVNLRQFISRRYDFLEPAGEKRSVDKNSWRLIDNIGRKQILKIISF